MRRLLEKIRNSQIVTSMLREKRDISERGSRVRTIFANFFLHLHPVAIYRHALRVRFTWCMGGIAFFLFLVEVITGALLMFYYRPTLEWAYQDMQDMRDVMSLGILREIHRWGAHLMVIVVWLHMLRVFLTGSYKHPREFNWVVGVVLLVFTLLLSFTGYLLPWDQLSMWAVTVGSNMAGAAPVIGADGPGSVVTQESDIRYYLLGSRVVSETTLNRFYIWHCVVLPLVAAIFMGVHFWRIRKDGFSRPL